MLARDILNTYHLSLTETTTLRASKTVQTEQLTTVAKCYPRPIKERKHLKGTQKGNLLKYFSYGAFKDERRQCIPSYYLGHLTLQAAFLPVQVALNSHNTVKEFAKRT